MRGLTRAEIQVLREMASASPPREISDDEEPLREALTARGLVTRTEEIEPIDEHYEDVTIHWDINDAGRLALRVCTVMP